MAGEGVRSRSLFSHRRVCLTPLSAKPKGKHSHISSVNASLSTHELSRLFKVGASFSSSCLLHMLTLCEDTPSNKIVSDLDAINDANMTRIIPPEILCESICHPPGAYVCQDRVSALRRSPTRWESHRQGCCDLHVHSSRYSLFYGPRFKLLMVFFLARTYPMLPTCYCSRKCPLSSIFQAGGEAMDEWNMGRT